MIRGGNDGVLFFMFFCGQVSTCPYYVYFSALSACVLKVRLWRTVNLLSSRFSAQSSAFCRLFLLLLYLLPTAYCLLLFPRQIRLNIHAVGNPAFFLAVMQKKIGFFHKVFINIEPQLQTLSSKVTSFKVCQRAG